MPLIIPTTEEQKDINLTNFETALGQTSPIANVAFLKVLSAVEALAFTTLYKYAAERALQNLALTATEEDLDRIGLEINIIRKVAVAAQLEIELSGTDSTVIPAGTDFVGDSNGIHYTSDASATITGGVAVINVTASTAGIVGNLLIGDTLSLTTPIAGADTQATITDTTTTGTEEETDTAYRLRVLNGLRTTLGGGNAEDYKAWAEEVEGVFRAFPFAGKPSGTSYPGDRIVYIEADSTIDPDGIAPSALLDDVRDNINTNPVTSKTREPLGLTNSTLLIESIVRLSIYVEIRGLDVDSEVEIEAKAAISDALDDYFRAMAPFVVGIDFEPDRNDIMTNLTISAIVQDIVISYNGSAEEVRFKLSSGDYYDRITLVFNQLAKLGGVEYV